MVSLQPAHGGSIPPTRRLQLFHSDVAVAVCVDPDPDGLATTCYDIKSGVDSVDWLGIRIIFKKCHVSGTGKKWRYLPYTRPKSSAMQGHIPTEFLMNDNRFNEKPILYFLDLVLMKFIGCSNPAARFQ